MPITKSFLEMMEIDVAPYCEHREAKDDKGRMVPIPYLPWAACKLLLHKEGAKVVDFSPVEGPGGSYVFSHKDVQDGKGNKLGCYFVKVHIVIDDLSFDYDYPLMNGNLVVRDETLNQLRISNAIARGFVKGVAVKTGLGYDLWLKDDESTKMGEDLNAHSIRKIQQRVEEKLSAAIRRYGTEDELLRHLGIKKSQLDAIMKSFNNIEVLEARL